MAKSIKRVDNFEFRWVESNYHPGYYEIVLWQDYDPDHLPEGATSKEYCYTIASWHKDSEGWDLHFVGNRAFDENKVDRHLFWELAKYGDRVANAEFDLEEKVKDFKNHIYY
jgi:hypothetical protein